MDKLSPEQIAQLAKEDKGPVTKSIIIAFTVIAIISVCLRMFTRFKFTGRAIGWEDYTIIISMVCAILTSVFQLLQVNAGSGKHAIFIPFPEGTVPILKYLFWSIIFYNLSLCFTKISILLQYARIFTVSGVRMAIFIVMGICIAYGIACFFTSVFSCVPVHAYWHVLEQAKAKCIPTMILWYVNAAFNILCDFLVAVVPIRAIWKLQIPVQQRLALLGILTIGWFICVVSLLRLHNLIIFSNHQDDSTWYSSSLAYWSSIEMNLSIVCASLPALKPLFVTLIPGFASNKGSRAYGMNSSGRQHTQSYGTKIRSQNSERILDDEVELGMNLAVSAHAYSTKSDHDIYGKNIHVARQFEQHFEGDGQSSDSESQKNLVDGFIATSK